MSHDYPLLLENKEYGIVVLFTANRIGTAVYSGASEKPLGYYSKGWKMDYFEPYYGAVSIGGAVMKSITGEKDD